MLRKAIVGPSIFPLLAQATETITAFEWARPRTGETAAHLPGLVDIVNKSQQTAQKHIGISHPVGEEGILWAEELRGWLIALGIASTRIRVTTA
ncbi:MAG: hypothetical protein GY731_16460 [Gammaproteobacteria bacterium]|nr:hypothetical protein [Gammaproteobacteria bacterium]